MKIRSVSLAMLVSASAVLMSACVVEPVRPPQPAPVAEVAPPPPAPGYRWARGALPVGRQSLGVGARALGGGVLTRQACRRVTRRDRRAGASGDAKCRLLRRISAGSTSSVERRNAV